MPPELQPTEENFPHLHSPSTGPGQIPPSPIHQPGTPHNFIWRMKPKPNENSTEEGRGKSKTPIPDSAPITRQGYRSGRLADDFWEVLAIPGTPTSPRKKLRILPFLTKNFDHLEYLVDKSKSPHTTIASANIAELLVGVPWTLPRVRQHIVNETAHALHKVLIFNNQHNTPFQKWDQGNWFSHWSTTTDGDHLCTCYVNIAVPENKVKIRKGRDFGWKKVPPAIHNLLTAPHTELIQDVAEYGTQWQDMAGGKKEATNPSPLPTYTPPANNPFAALSEEKETSS